MTTVKTGISLDEDLYKQMVTLAEALHVSRSELVSMAVRDFLREQENKRIFDRLNDVYREGPDPDDVRMLQGLRQLYDRSTKQDW